MIADIQINNNILKKRIWDNTYNEYSRDGQTDYKYEYDSKNKIIEGKSTNDGGISWGNWTNKYDDKGNKESIWSWFGRNGTEFLLNERGDTIEESSYTGYSDGNCCNEKFTFKYNNYGKIIEKIKYTEYKCRCEPTSKWTYDYDEYGNLIEESYYYWDGYGKEYLDVKSVYEYEYDAVGNWIKKYKFSYVYIMNNTKIENPQPVKSNESWERIINYF